MKKLKISLAVMLFLMGAGAATLHANPLPSCSDEWCHFTKPNIAYIADVRDLLPGFDTGPQNWMPNNCPNWPNINDPVFRVLSLPQRLNWDYDDEVNALWEKNHPKDKGIIRGGEEKIREEQYLAAQKKKYGKNIPYCLTEKAQDRVQQARRETEKYLHAAQDVPMVRDRLAMLAKIEEANAKTAKELGLMNLYKATPVWQIDKATLDAWWEETHPNGKALDKQAIKQRYKDYFEKQEWKRANPNTPQPSIEEMKQQNEDRRNKAREEHENDRINWWAGNCSNGVEQKYINYMERIYNSYFDDVDELWLKYHKEPTYTSCIGICKQLPKFSVPFEEREKFYFDREQKLYGKQVPYCLNQHVRASLQKGQQELQEKIESEKGYLQRFIERGPASPLTIKHLDGSITTITREEQAKKHAKLIAQRQEKIDKLTAELEVVQQALDSIPQMAEKLGLDLQSPLDPLRDPTVSFPPDEQEEEYKQQLEAYRQQLEKEEIHKERIRDFGHFLLVGLVALGIVAGAAIILLKRKKNLPK